MAQGWTADLTTIVRHNRKARGAGQEEGLEPLGGCGSRGWENLSEKFLVLSPPPPLLRPVSKIK